MEECIASGFSSCEDYRNFALLKPVKTTQKSFITIESTKETKKVKFFEEILFENGFRQDGAFLVSKGKGVFTIKYANGNNSYRSTTFGPIRMMERWYNSGTPSQVSSYFNNKLHGIDKRWYPNEMREYETNYKNGEKHGLSQNWHPNGQKSSQGSYHHDFKVGEWLYWDDAGKMNDYIFNT